MEHSEELRNENPAALISLFDTYFLASYGWYLLIAFIASVYIYDKIIYKYVRNYWQRKAEAEYAAKYHKDPDLLNSRISTMEQARKMLQEKYNLELDDFKIKQQQREEKKRQEWLEKHNSSTEGTKLGRREKVDDEKKKSLRSDYNPLSGDASGSSYRAPKKSCCGGGGCG